MKMVLSALGLLNALGNNKTEVLENFLAGVAPGMQQERGWIPERDVWVGKVTGSLPAVPAQLAMFECRNNRLLLAAIAQIQDAIDAAIAMYGRERIGVVIGSSTSGIAEGEAALSQKMRDEQWPAHFDYRQQEIGSPSEFIARFLGISGAAYTVSTACSSSAKIFGSARQLLELGLCDAVICGGSDSLCKLTLNGFSALEAMSAGRCEPFASGRDGINIGEGAALFLMTREPVGALLAAPSMRNATNIYLAGIGESADAHHISAPHPDGIGAETAMRTALQDAKITAENIHYINLHGTATPLNDAMESAAVFRVFGSNTSCSSTKPLTGHTLGAAGATEAALCWLLLSVPNESHELPPQINRAIPDTSLSTIAILREKKFLPANKTLCVLSNSFAFGGSNAAVILETCYQEKTG
jgi:3-oxoacyl-[acyl-carrier-protein] synthase-1